MVSGVALGDDVPVAAMVTEDEGATAVISTVDALERNLETEFVAAWLTLNVNSALDSVGLTAAVSGYHHDHLLVPIDRAEQAIAVLNSLREGRCS
jgi:hypothetical protein